MSNALNSRGFKLTLGSLATVVGLLMVATPYLNVVARQDSQAAEIKELKTIQTVDHDTLIRMSSDLHYVKENIGDIKLLLQQVRQKQNNQP